MRLDWSLGCLFGQGPLIDLAFTGGFEVLSGDCARDDV